MAPRNGNATTESKEAILRRKLVNTELNPIMDIILSVVILIMTPFIYLFSLIHDKLMFKFLNKTYIYNVSWEVRYPLAVYLSSCLRQNSFLLYSYSNLCTHSPSSPPSSFFQNRILAWTTACSTSPKRTT